MFVALVVLLVFRRSLLGYLNDQYYQEHFVYLWVFLGLALGRTLKGPFRARFGLASRRDRLGVAALAFATVLYAVSTAGGTSTGARMALVVLATGFAVLAVPRWSVRRCVMHGLLMLACFGIPYAVYLPLSSMLQWGVANVISWPARLGLVDYVVESTIVVFPHYELAITLQCSGFGQLLTFCGIAALGVLGSAPNRRRSVLLFVLAVALAWASNLARVALFVFLVGVGASWAVDDQSWHAALGFLLFLPFVAVLVGVILRTHRPIELAAPAALPAGRFPMVLGVLPLLVLSIPLELRGAHVVERPHYLEALEAPPGHTLEMRSPTEESDRGAYETPWLVNARFRRDADSYFDLLHYVTGSHGHLCVHKIAACLQAPDQTVRYAGPVEVDGRRWWRISLDRDDPSASAHVYFAFEVDGERRDDSYWTQLRVLWSRLVGSTWQVELTRVMLQGTLPEQPTAYETEVLSWIGRTTDGGR